MTSPPRLDFASASRLIEAITAPVATLDVEVPMIPGFAVESFIGEGSGGRVYKARWAGRSFACQDGSSLISLPTASPSLQLALKLLAAPLGSGRAAQRAWRELAALERLQLPGVPRLLDYGLFESRLYIATEFIDGAPLDVWSRSLPQQRSDRELRARVAMLAQVADVVQSIHEHGVIHRDLKPSNILVDAGSRPHVVDLGLAIFDDTGSSTLTETGAVLGTPAFMSPEQARAEGEQISTRSDVYSLGAIAYLLLTGATPHDVTTSIHEAVRRVAQDPPRDPNGLMHRLPRGLSAVLMKACAREPRRRYASAAELAADLRRWLGGDSVAAEPPRLAMRVARFARRHALSVSIVLGLSLGGLLSISAMWAAARVRDSTLLAHSMADGRIASIRTLRDRVVAEWDTGMQSNVVASPCTVRPITSSPGVAVFGFRRSSQCFPGELCFFDLADPSAPPITRGSSLELPAFVPPFADGQNSFQPEEVIQADVFDKNPGDEVVCLHTHTRNSWTCCRVYAVDGTILWEIWHDGRLHAVHWIPDSGLLVLAGVNSEKLATSIATDRLSEYPFVVFAVRPARCATGQQAGLRLSLSAVTEWYHTISADCQSLFVPQRMTLGPGSFHEDRDASVRFTLALSKHSGHMEWMLDSGGRIVSSVTLPSALTDSDDPVWARALHNPFAGTE